MVFSNKNREETRLKVKNKTFDLLIIGGGLTGASVALDAATRGMSTVLLEMSDFATKGSARHVMLTTEQEDYYHKTWKWLEVEKAFIKANFSPLYHKMAGINIKYRDDYDLKSMSTIKKGLLYPFKRNYIDQSLQVLRKDQVLQMIPSVNSKKLERGLLFENGWINRSLMTIELLKKAKQLGACPLNYFKVVEFIYDDQQQIVGVKAEDQLNGQIVSFHAHQVVNTTGAALNNIRDLDRVDGKGDYAPLLKKVIQFELNLTNMPLNDVVSFSYGKNNSFISLTPFKNRLIVTVTEPVNLVIKFDEKEPTLDIRQYLTTVQQILKEEALKEVPVTNSHYAYVVQYKQKTLTNNLVAISESGLISAIGTSTIAFRPYASKIVDVISKGFKKDLNILYSDSDTESISVNKNNKIKKEELLETPGQISLSDQKLNQLIKRYGDRARDLLLYYQKAEEYADRYQIDQLLCAEILYAIDETAIYTPLDFFIRRSRLDYDPIVIREQLKGIIKLFSNQLPWTKEEHSYFVREMKIWLKELND